MKKAGLATRYKFNIKQTVGIAVTMQFSLGVTKKSVGKAFKNAGLDPDTVAQNKINELNKRLIESENSRAESEKKRVQAEAKNVALQNQIDVLLIENEEYKKLAIEDREKLAQDIIKYWRADIAKEKEKNKKKDKPIVYLASDGFIYREPKEKYFHRVDVNSRRGKFLLAIMGNKDYTPTRTLIDITGFGSRKSVESAVYEMKNDIKEKLKIENFIDGYQDYGYRINPAVIFKKA